MATLWQTTLVILLTWESFFPPPISSASLPLSAWRLLLLTSMGWYTVNSNQQIFCSTNTTSRVIAWVNLLSLTLACLSCSELLQVTRVAGRLIHRSILLQNRSWALLL